MARRLMRSAAWIVVCAAMVAADSRVTRVNAARTQVGRGSIAAGRAHSVLAAPDGRVLAWGAGGRGQLGNGSLIDRVTPEPVPNLEGIVLVSAGAVHTVALSSSGEVFAWGANTFGRLGDGTQKRRATPVRVQGLGGVRMIAAGRAHTLALTNDGAVYAWGLNDAGQLGIGRKKKMALAPERVPELANVIAIAAGDAHSLAVTNDGHLYAWGRNNFSALGDGTTKDRLKPTRVNLTNVIGVAAGAAHSLALVGSGAVYSWGRGTEGELGTGSTKVAATPTLIANLTAQAIAAGRHYSAAIRTDGRLVMWGANHSGQLGDGTTVRRLRPTVVEAVDAVANVALGRSHVMTVTVTGDVRVWGEGDSGRLGSGTVTDQTTPFEIMSDVPDWGEEPREDPVPPEPPTIGPRTGIYPAPQLVTLTPHAPQDIVRYTLGGEEPSDTSTQYAGPFVAGSSVTVIARSFTAEGLSSTVRAETLTIDTVPPSIAVSASPALQEGWITVPVTVSFECSDNLGVAICPTPVVVSEDAAARTITGTAIDLAGHQVAASVVVNVDVQAPQLSIDVPQNGALVNADSVALTGFAADAGSGLASVRCNSLPASMVDGRVDCAVPLRVGRNDIVLSATDHVGHSASTAVTITRAATESTLHLSPQSRLVAVGETARLSLSDDAGAIVTDASWASSDNAVVSLSAGDPSEFTAVAPGQAIVTAGKDGMVVEAEITVVAELKPGDTRWTLPAFEGSTPESPLFANRVSADVPDLFAIDTPAWGEATLRAVTADGEVLWRQTVAGIPLMGDTFGGVVVGELYDINQGDDFRAYLRAGGGTIRPWRYDSPGSLLRPAQSRDGTIYALEYLSGGLDLQGDEIWDKYVVVIDGATGNLLKRIMLAREIVQFTSDHDGEVLSASPLGPFYHCRTTRAESAPQTVGPVVGHDGRGYLLVRRYVNMKRGTCLEGTQRPDRTIDLGLDVMIVSANAPPAVVQVFSTQCTEIASSGATICDGPFHLDQLLPDGLGGTMVSWRRATAIINNRTAVMQRYLTRVDEDGLATDRPVPLNYSINRIGQDGTAYTVSGGTVTAFNVITGATRWTAPLPNTMLLAAAPTGGVAAVDFTTGDLKITDDAGSVTTTQSLGNMWSAVQWSGDWIGQRDGKLTAVSGMFDDATRFASADLTTRQQRSRTPGKGIYAKSHLAKQTIFDLLRYRHFSIRVVPHDQAGWLSRLAMPGIDAFGNRFFTLGAGSGDDDSSAFCGGLLVSALNRHNDVTTLPWDPPELLAYPASFEDRKIEELLSLDSAYDDDLPYACRPEQNPGSFNSNSYAHGLLRAARLPVPRLPGRIPALVPGWGTPVPDSKFQ